MLKHKHNGFTIVELLIVIVVIGILAAITIVAYNGIQVRAKNTSAASTAKGMVSMLKTYSVSNTTLQANTVTKDHLCLGNPGEFPAISGMGAGECRNDIGMGNWKADDNFASELGKVGRASSATALVTATDGQRYRGIWYDDNSATDPRVYYALQGASQTCAVSGATAVSGNGITICNVRIDFMINYLAP
ncbi:MAG: prepilin-type N-terminal cleavage/methylation domain-containing protein [Patescibacteria group bacterium]